MPVFGSPREYTQVSVGFDNNLILPGIVLPHPNPCMAYVVVLGAPSGIPLTDVFGLDVYAGSFDNFIKTYNSSSVRIPFLYVLDELNKTNFDFNLKGRINFSFLYAGFFNDRDNAYTNSAQNIFVYNYLPVMLKNADIEIEKISEFSDLRLYELDKQKEMYVLKIDAHLYNLTNHL